MDHLCHSCLVFVMLSRLFIAALWAPAGKGLTSWLLFVTSNCDFVTFPCGICQSSSHFSAESISDCNFLVSSSVLMMQYIACCHQQKD